jgi:hypothetical protein
MAKPGKKSSSKKLFRIGALAVVAFLAVGTAYAASSGDIAYGSKSLLAAVLGVVDTTPRIVIERNANSRSTAMWPYTTTNIAQFDVYSKYTNSYGYLNFIEVRVVPDRDGTDLKLAKYTMRYSYCASATTGDCRDIAIPVATSKYGYADVLNPSVQTKLPVYAGQSPGVLSVGVLPYYATTFNNSGLPTVYVRALVVNATGAAQICSGGTGAQTCTTAQVAVPVYYSNLGYGNSLPLSRGSGFGYGQYDLNNNGILNTADTDLLKNIIKTLACPLYKVCDIDRSGSYTQADVSLLGNYASGSTPPPLQVLAPDGGGYYTKGTSYPIYWSGGSVSWPITIVLNNSTDTKTVRTLATGLKNNGVYQWTVPTDLPADAYKILISCQSCGPKIPGRLDNATSYFKVVDGLTAVGSLGVSVGIYNPKSALITVGSSTTSGVTLLNFDMKAANQNLVVHDLKAEFRTSDNLIGDVVSNVKLVRGSTVIGSKSVTAGSAGYGSVTFSNIDQAIAKDSTHNYSIVVDLKGNAAYGDGTTLIASTTVVGWAVSDANGSSVIPSSAVAGNVQTLTSANLSTNLNSATVSVSPATVSGAGDVAQYTIKFTAIAGDQDLYISGKAARGPANSTNISFATTTTSSTNTTTTPGSGNYFTAAGTVTGDSAGGYYRIPANTSRQFTLNVTLVGTSLTGGYTGVALRGIGYGVTPALGAVYIPDQNIFRTNDVRLLKLQ